MPTEDKNIRAYRIIHCRRTEEQKRIVKSGPKNNVDTTFKFLVFWIAFMHILTVFFFSCTVVSRFFED